MPPAAHGSQFCPGAIGSQNGYPLFKLYYKNNDLEAMGLQRPTTANLAMGPIRAQNGPQLLKLYYENNDLEARGLQRPTAANLTRGGNLALEWSAAFKSLLKKQ